MKGEDILALRRHLGETIHEFGARFAVSGRTIEGWECEHRIPNALVHRLLDQLAARVTRKPAEKARGKL